MNHRPNDPGPARPARRRPRAAPAEIKSTAAPTPAAPRVHYWGDTGTLAAADPAADRPWALATLAILVIVILAAVGPLIPG